MHRRGRSRPRISRETRSLSVCNLVLWSYSGCHPRALHSQLQGCGTRLGTGGDTLSDTADMGPCVEDWA